MAVDLIFKDDQSNELQLFATLKNDLFIEIRCDDLTTGWIILSKQDAIKLSKELKKQINVINVAEKSGGSNG